MGLPADPDARGGAESRGGFGEDVISIDGEADTVLRQGDVEAANMTPEQIDEAKRLVGAGKPKLEEQQCVSARPHDQSGQSRIEWVRIAAKREVAP